MIWMLLTLGILGLFYLIGILLLGFRRKKSGIAVLALALAATVFFAVGAALCWDGPESAEAEPDYGLLLGCGLHKGQATPELVRRCEAALQWMEENRGKPLIVSGGDPGEQGVTEAAVMAAWLRNHGARADRILLEDRASDTRENLLYSLELAEEQGLETGTVEIITSEYHQTRAAFLARRSGQQTLHTSARTPFPQHVVASVREVWCMASELLGL